ncbi:MAG: hypothetical protein U0V56_00055 [Actinomycetota bacterium]
MSANSVLEAGGLLDFLQSEAGGWDPFTRPAEWVLEDVRDQLVSPERAESARMASR